LAIPWIQRIPQNQVNPHIAEGGCVDKQTQENPIRLLLLAGQALFRASLARLLEAEHSLEVVGVCGNSIEALAVLKASPVDVVLVDSDDGASTRDGFLSAARRCGYQGRFLILAGTAEVGDPTAPIQLGASGIFLKSEAPDRLVQAIALVANGSVWLEQRTLLLLADQSIDRRMPFDGERSGDLLSIRERKVLSGILGGLTNKKIGEDLGLSEGAVKTSVQQLFHRAGVRRRSQLVRAALEGSLGTAHSPRELATAGGFSIRRQPNG
jgi:DNA-binding NarL/FixJ family response regulator